MKTVAYRVEKNQKGDWLVFNPFGDLLCVTFHCDGYDPQENAERLAMMLNLQYGYPGSGSRNEDQKGV